MNCKLPVPKLAKGISLIELLVVILMSAIVTGAAFSIYRLNSSYYLTEEARLERNQNLRAALFILGRELRSAGNGLGILGNISLIEAYVPSLEIIENGRPSIKTGNSWFKHADTTDYGARAIFGLDGGSDQPDTLTIFRSEAENGSPLGQVKSIRGNDIELKEELMDGSVEEGDILALVSGRRAVLMETGPQALDSSLEIRFSGRFTGPSMPSKLELSGAWIYNLRDVSLTTFYVEDNCLVAAYYDIGRKRENGEESKTQVVAENIEDLELYYFWDGEKVHFNALNQAPNLSSERLKKSKISAVSLALVARSASYQGLTGVRPALFNRQAGKIKDNYQRSSLLETIYLRNYR